MVGGGTVWIQGDGKRMDMTDGKHDFFNIKNPKPTIIKFGRWERKDGLFYCRQTGICRVIIHSATHINLKVFVLCRCINHSIHSQLWRAQFHLFPCSLVPPNMRVPKLQLQSWDCFVHPLSAI